RLGRDRSDDPVIGKAKPTTLKSTQQSARQQIRGLRQATAEPILRTRRDALQMMRRRFVTSRAHRVGGSFQDDTEERRELRWTQWTRDRKAQRHLPQRTRRIRKVAI